MKTMLLNGMRGIALVIFAITLLGLSATGQNRQEVLSEDLLKSTQTTLFTKDSSYTYRWDQTSSAWEGLWKKQYIYNENSNIAEINYYLFDSSSKTYKVKWKEIYSYDAIEDLLMECEFQEFNDQTKQWESSQLFTYQYSNKTLLSCIVEKWDNASSSWVNWRLDSFIYDLNGRKKEYQIEYWNDDAGDWSNSMKSVPVYNNGGNIEEEICESWVANNWQNLSSETITYNSKGLKSIMTKSVWDAAWINQDRFTYLYNTTNQLSEVTHLAWSTSINNWSNSNKILYSYDDNGNQLKEVHQKFNTETSGWDLTMNQETYWTKKSISTDVPKPDSNTMALYPNPAMHELFISGVESNTPISIYDMTGKLIKTIDNYFAGNSINVSDLGMGVYIIKANNQVSQFVKK